MTSNAHFTPLRYPGGKGKLAEFIKSVVINNGLAGGCYVEPYAGGAAIATELLLLDYVEEVHINDLNPGIFSFWKSALFKTTKLIDLIKKTDVTIEEWHRQKSIYSSAEVGSLDLGFATFFLNRCNRSGILKAGVIGGKNQSGKWKLDARFNKPDLINRIEQISRFNERIHLHNIDALKLLKRLSKSLPQNTLIYLDPPYYVKGEGLYDNFYTHNDHIEISKEIQGVKSQQWIVSYDDVDQIEAMYPNKRKLRYGLSYSAADERQKGKEIMFFSDDLVIPPIPSKAPMHSPAIQI